MHQLRRRKLNTLLFILTVLALSAALVLYALRQNISLFYTPSQVHLGQAPTHQSIRIGGMVKKGSLSHDPVGLGLHFTVTDFSHTIQISYNGMLPDLFREGQGVVVEGELMDNHQLQARQVLAKHDANYMPPEVRASLKGKVDA